MNSNQLLNFIYELTNNGIKIWIENNKIQLFVPEEISFSKEKKTQLEKNKDKVLHYLQKNRVYSKKYKLLILSTEEKRAILSFAQERLWFVEKYEEGTNAYNVPMVFTLSNNININILESSVKGVISRHEILRSLIKEDEEGNGYQLVLDEQEHPLKVTKVIIPHQAALNEELKNDNNYVFDLSNEYPIRVSLYEIDNVRKQFLGIVIHHIAFDGWSTDIFLKELQEYYSYYLNKSKGIETYLNLPELTIQYKDFVLWQRSYLTGERLEKQLSYWKNKLVGYETLNLITDKVRPAQIDYSGRDIYFKIDKDTSNYLREVAKELKVSLYSLLLAGYYLMLRIYSNQDDIVIGMPIANRHYSQIEDLIGFFVNTLALRIKIDTTASIKEFIKQIGEEVIAAQLHQDLPFEKLVEELKVAKDTSRHPIFQVMFSLQDFDNNSSNKTEDIEKEDKILHTYTADISLYEVAKFDISTLIDDNKECLNGCFNYAINLYNEETISRFIETYIEVLKQFASLANNARKQEELKVSGLTYLGQAGFQQMINAWNNTSKAYPDNKTIHMLFEEQVEKTPDSIAVVCETELLTYSELNSRTNRLANYLISIHAINPDMLVGLYMDRNEYALIAILGVLKAGGTYVPMEPSYPDDRIKCILKDTKIEIILTNEVYKEKLENIINTYIDKTVTETVLKTNECVNILTIDSITLQKQLLSQLAANPRTTTTIDNLAYVIYTSGTTGTPKGVLIDHKGLCNLLNWYTKTYQFMETDKVLIISSFSFDLTQKNILGVLIRGGQVHIPLSFYDIQNINNIIQNQLISLLNCAPTAFYPLLEEAVDSNQLSSLRYVFVGGEKLVTLRIKKIIENGLSCQVVNTYGPTECSDITTSYLVTESEIKNNSVLPIGRPIDNMYTFVLDNNLQLLPIGAIGELYIGGVGLARGYLNRADITAEKFVANPFLTKNGAGLGKNSRLYKTGDIVRWLPTVT